MTVENIDGLDFEGLLVKKIVMEGPTAVATVLDSGVTPEMMFSHGRAGLAYVIDFFLKYDGKVPDWSTVVAVDPRFGDLSDDHLKNPVEFFTDLIWKRWERETLRQGTDRIQTALERDDLEGVKKFALDMVQQAEHGSEIKTTVEATQRKDIEVIWKEYLELKSRTGPDGIPTPWDTITGRSMGIHKGELWFLTARLKVGKTWTLLLFGKKAWESGKSVLFISMEMKPRRIQKRLYALVCKLPWEDFKNGKLNKAIEDQFEAFTQMLEKGPRFRVVGSDRVKTARDVEILIEETRPDLVIIDGLYFMSGKGNAGWEQLTDAVTQLQRIAIKKDVPIMGSTQFNRDVGEEDDDPEAGQIGYAYGISQAADVLMAAIRTKDMKLNRQMRIKMLEARDFPRLTLDTNWNLTTMDFSEIGVVYDEGDENSSMADVGIAGGSDPLKSKYPAVQPEWTSASAKADPLVAAIPTAEIKAASDAGPKPPPPPAAPPSKPYLGGPIVEY